MATVPKVDVGADYKEKYGFFVPEDYIFKAKRGLNPEIVKEISWMKKEPEWMLKFRLRSLEMFRKKPMPNWGADLSVIDFENIFYYLKASDKQSTSWEDLPPDIKKTYDRLGVPEAERKFLAGVSAQYESEVVYHSLHEELSKKGVIFTDTDSALRDHPELFKEYFGTVIPPADNKFAALNSAVWSGGSFIYVPKGVRVDIPLQAYFRINAENMGQFERTLIICDEGSFVHYIEGCHSPNATVRVSDGEKAIKDVERGDFVLTHKGRWREVLETQKRRHRGDMLAIEFEGERYRQLSVTPGHPFLVGRRDENGHISQHWLEAHQLNTGDLLAVPAIQEMSVAPETELLTEVSVGRGRHTAVMEDMAVKLTTSTCWLIGIYLAEGSAPANRSYVNFDSHTDEIDERQRVRKAMLEAFELEPWEFAYADRAGISLRYSSVHAARWFIDQFGRLTAQKRLPDWVFGLPADQRAAIVAGFYAGEGHWNPEADCYRINQTNQSLGQRVRELLLTLGIRSSLSRSARPAPRLPIWQLYVSPQDNRLFEEKVLGTVPLPRKHPTARLEIADGFMWTPIRGINAIWTELDVYNLKVEEDESYVCEGVVSHNCTAPIYTTDSLHSAVVEIIVKKEARCRYTTIQNWSTNVFNLVTKRALAYQDATMEWVDGNLGCLAAGTRIFTNNDVKLIENVGVGDFVYSLTPEFRWVRQAVTATKVNPPRPTWRMTTADQREVVATDNHPFLVLRKTGRLRQVAWMPLSDIRVGDEIAISGVIPDHGHPYEIPRTELVGNKEFKAPRATDVELMWLLGFYLGDGTKERGRVTFCVPRDDKSYLRVGETVRSLFGLEGKHHLNVQLRYSSTDFSRFIDTMGFGGTARSKRLPEWVYTLPVDQKKALIDGYIAADGHIRPNHKNLSLTSASRDLLEDVKALALSAGLNPLKVATWTRIEKKPLGTESKEYTHHFLYFGERTPDAPVYFSPVISIVEAGEQPTYDIEVDGQHNFIANGVLAHNSQITMKYPSVYLMEPGAKGDVLSVAFAGKGQHQDAGGKMIHVAPNTTSTITSKSISKGGGRTSYRGHIKMYPGANNSKSFVKCDALLLDDESRSDTYPYNDVDAENVTLGHEATVSKVSDEQLFYLMSRGITRNEAETMIVNGFIEPFTKELPLEYAVELNRLIQLEMEGSVG